MKRGKAIELLKAIIETGEYEGDPDDSDAIKLGIEALRKEELKQEIPNKN